MDEFGETPSIYVWPVDHIEGQPFPDGFWDNVRAALRAVGIDYEAV